MSLVQDFKRRFALATPQQKRFWILAGGGGTFLLVLFALTSLKPPPPKKLSDKLESRVIAPPRRNIDLDSIAATQTNIQRQLNEISSRLNMAENDRNEMGKRFNDQLQDVVSGKIGGDSFSKELDERVTRRIERMKAEGQLGLPGAAQTGSVQLGAPLPAAIDTNVGPIMPPEPNDPSAETGNGAKRGRLRQIVAEENSGADDATQGKVRAKDEGVVTLANATYPTPGRGNANSSTRDRVSSGQDGGGQTWLPAGALLKGVLITGMDAPASPAAQKQPTPALVRIKDDAILPNFFKVNIKECFVLVDGYGQLSSERALLRTQRMTCVRNDGGVVEVNLDGYLVGEDGKVGLRGRPVTKEGAMIARTISAGMLSGVGSRLAGNGGNGGISIGAGGAGGGFSIGGNSLEQAASVGVGTSFNKVADFYLDLAKEMVPVIEIDAGREATIVLVHGVSIKNTKF